MFRNLYKSALKINTFERGTKTAKKVVEKDSTKSIKTVNKTFKKTNKTVNQESNKESNKKILIQPETKKYNDMPLL
tara:strand:- start:277 stop:504 length:228 start_codon:yes stop_codon:yes gene_type:complete